MHFHYMTYMATSQHKNPCLGGHEINNLGRPFLGHITIELFCLKHASKQRRRCFKKYINFTLFTPQLPLHWGGGGYEIYNFWSSCPTDATCKGNPCTKFGIDQVKGSKDIEQTTLDLQTDRPTATCKIICHLFQRGRTNRKLQEENRAYLNPLQRNLK